MQILDKDVELKDTPKVKDFLWRACNEYLPTRTALSMKYVPITTQCPACNAAEQTTLHCLVQCNFAQACGRDVGFYYTATEHNFMSWLENMMVSNCSAKVHEIVDVIVVEENKTQFTWIFGYT